MALTMIDMNDKRSALCVVSWIFQDDGIFVREIHDLFHAREKMDGEYIIALIYLKVFMTKYTICFDDNPNGGLEIILHWERIDERGLKSIQVETAEDTVIHLKDAARQSA